METVGVKLTDDELEQARNYACERLAEVLERHGQSHGKNQADLKGRLIQDMIGTMGEMAVAKYLGHDWTAPRTYEFKSNDVGEYEVKTRNPAKFKNLSCKLIDADRYPPSRIYILAWADHRSPVVTIAGWTTLGNIVDHDNVRNEWAAYIYPYCDLFPIKALK